MTEYLNWSPCKREKEFQKSIMDRWAEQERKGHDDDCPCVDCEVIRVDALRHYKTSSEVDPVSPKADYQNSDGPGRKSDLVEIELLRKELNIARGKSSEYFSKWKASELIAKGKELTKDEIGNLECLLWDVKELLEPIGHRLCELKQQGETEHGSN